MSTMQYDKQRDDRLTGAMEALDPTPEAVRRMERAALEAYDRRRLSLAQEWIELLRVRPILHGGACLAASLALVLTTPLGTLASMLAR